MNTTTNDPGHSYLDNGTATSTAARGGGQSRRGAGDRNVHDLMADVQDLLGQLAHVADPDIARLRTKVTETLATAKRSVTDGADQIQRHARDVVRVGDTYVRNQPWQAVGIAAVVGALVGVLVARR